MNVGGTMIFAPGSHLAIPAVEVTGVEWDKRSAALFAGNGITTSIAGLRRDELSQGAGQRGIWVIWMSGFSTLGAGFQFNVNITDKDRTNIVIYEGMVSSTMSFEAHWIEILNMGSGWSAGASTLVVEVTAAVAPVNANDSAWNIWAKYLRRA